MWPGVCSTSPRSLADVKAVAFLEQLVELAAVALELGALVEDLAEGVLHHGDLVADADLAAEVFLQIGRGGQVVGMDVGFENPRKFKAFVFAHGR